MHDECPVADALRGRQLDGGTDMLRGCYSYFHLSSVLMRYKNNAFCEVEQICMCHSERREESENI
jgi:hypothetical protein